MKPGEHGEPLFVSKCDKHAPMMKKKVRGQNCPCLTNEIKQIMRERDSYLKKARRPNAEVHWSSYRRIRNRVVNKIKFEKGRYSKETLENNMDDPKTFWNTVKGIFYKQEIDVRATSVPQDK